MTPQQGRIERKVVISSDKLEGDLIIPPEAKALVLFAHGSGSGRHSSRNQYIAEVLNESRFATLLVDLLNQKEKEIDERRRHLRFDINLLTNRLLAITYGLAQEPETIGLDIGYFGSSTGAAAALTSAVKLNGMVKTIVCRGGRLDLTDERILQQIRAPILLIVGSKDSSVIVINRIALNQLSSAEARELAIIPGAGHLLEEEGKIEEVAKIAVEWFNHFLLGNNLNFTNKYRDRRTEFLSQLRAVSLTMRFRDRIAAGEMLASLLGKYGKEENPVVLGIARGGVIIAKAIANMLRAEIDILVPRRLASPLDKERSIGSIMHDGSVYLDKFVIESEGISREYVDAEILRKSNEIEQMMKLYRSKSKVYSIRNRTVFLVDDGAATGSTLIVAARWIRHQQPKRLIIAVPVVPRSIANILRKEADIVEAFRAPSSFKSVEQFYDDFGTIQDAEILDILKHKE